jgi:hypothetical protein
MVSAIDRAKRALVTVIKYLAGVYGVAADVNRDSKDDVLRKAYRKLSVKVHPDKGGKSEEQAFLNGAYEAWLAANQAQTGKPKASPARSPAFPAYPPAFPPAGPPAFPARPPVRPTSQL